MESLHTRAGFEAFVATLKATTLSEQWGSLVAKVGGKVYALIGLGDQGGVVFRLEELSFDMLSSLDGIDQAPYFARRRWVRVAPGSALGDEELKAYLARSYDIIRAGLTRRLRAELGIEDQAQSRTR